MADARGPLEVLNRLRGMGVGISIDDFGTGLLVADVSQAACQSTN